MAAPPEKTLKDLNGKWVMNKSLSDDTDSILQMQNIGWLLRKAIGLATITLTITEYTEDKVTHVDTKNTLTGNIKGTTELRSLDWTWRDHEDGIFGKLKGRTRWIRLGDLKAGDGTEESDLPFLTGGWEGGLDDDHVQSYVESRTDTWTANQIWGFEDVAGVRRHVRHVVVRKGDDWKQARLVYDFTGPAAAAAGTKKEEEEDDGLAYGDK